MKTKFDREGNFIHLGNFDFGREVVGLLAEVGSGSGEVNMSWANPKKSHKAYHSRVEGLPYITVGLDQTTWGMCLGVLLHEAVEFAMIQRQVRFRNEESHSKSLAGFTFIFDHEQYTDIIARVGPFIAACQTAMNKAWKARKQFKSK